MGNIDFEAAQEWLDENHNGLTDEQNWHRFTALVKGMVRDQSRRTPLSPEERAALDAAPLPRFDGE